jgi:biopolymer transport protein ExbD
MIAIERNERRTKPIPLTPLIDVVFLLIVFFMLSSSFVRIESLGVTLPDMEEQGQDVTKSKVTVIDLTRDGRVYVNSKRIWQTDLDGSLRVTFKKYPDRQILIRAAEGVTVQQLIDMMDSVALAGGKNVSVHKLVREEVPPAERPATTGATE